MHFRVHRNEFRLVDRLGNARRGKFRLRRGLRRCPHAEKHDKGGQKQKGIPEKESPSRFHNPPTLQIWCVFPGIAVGTEDATSLAREPLSYYVVA